MAHTVRETLKRAMRLHGALATGDDPSADELTDALLTMNTLKRSMFGTIIGPRLASVGLIGTTGQAESGGKYAIPAAAFTLTAPLNPKSGARFGVADANLNFGTNACTINRNGRLIEGAASNLSLSTNGDNRTWFFDGHTGNWILEKDYATVDDSIEFPDALVSYLPNMLAVAMAAEFGSEIRADVVAGANEGRQAFARQYGRRGRNQSDMPIGVQIDGGGARGG